jgi:hypothetical protein
MKDLNYLELIDEIEDVEQIVITNQMGIIWGVGDVTT